MANGRQAGARYSVDRDGSQFVIIPFPVLDSKAFQQLRYPARALLLELARQLGPSNNGQLRTGMKYLRAREWKSADVVNRAKAELLEAGFIHETVKGQRPNKASWYAVTWLALQDHPRYDPGAKAGFVRSAYRKGEPLALKLPMTKEETIAKWKSAA